MQLQLSSYNNNAKLIKQMKINHRLKQVQKLFLQNSLMCYFHVLLSLYMRKIMHSTYVSFQTLSQTSLATPPGPPLTEG